MTLLRYAPGLQGPFATTVAANIFLPKMCRHAPISRKVEGKNILNKKKMFFTVGRENDTGGGGKWLIVPLSSSLSLPPPKINDFGRWVKRKGEEKGKLICRRSGGGGAKSTAEEPLTPPRKLNSPNTSEKLCVFVGIMPLWDSIAPIAGGIPFSEFVSVVKLRYFYFHQ